MYENEGRWKDILESIHTAEGLKDYLDHQVNLFVDIKNSEDRGLVSVKQVGWAVDEITAAILKTIDAVEITLEEIHKKDSKSMMRRISKALEAGNWETENIKRLVAPVHVKTAVITRLNDLYLLTKSVEEFNKSKEWIKEAVKRTQEQAHTYLKQRRRSFKAKKDPEDIRDGMVDQFGFVKNIPPGHSAVVQEKYKRLRKRVQKPPR